MRLFRVARSVGISGRDLYGMAGDAIETSAALGVSLRLGIFVAANILLPVAIAAPLVFAYSNPDHLPRHEVSSLLGGYFVGALLVRMPVAILGRRADFGSTWTRLGVASLTFAGVLLYWEYAPGSYRAFGLLAGAAAMLLVSGATVGALVAGVVALLGAEAVIARYRPRLFIIEALLNVTADLRRPPASQMPDRSRWYLTRVAHTLEGIPRAMRIPDQPTVHLISRWYQLRADAVRELVVRMCTGTLASSTPTLVDSVAALVPSTARGAWHEYPEAATLLPRRTAGFQAKLRTILPAILLFLGLYFAAPFFGLDPAASGHLQTVALLGALVAVAGGISPMSDHLSNAAKSVDVFLPRR